mgnify:CR=1 FL=1
MRAAFDGRLWAYLEVRCDTVTSLFEEVQEIVDRHVKGGEVVDCSLKEMELLRLLIDRK